MTTLPEDLELRPDITQDTVIDELDRKCSLLMYGREEQGDGNEPGDVTAIRSVVIVAGVVALKTDGTLGPLAVGTFNGASDARGLSTLPALASKLREIARDLDLLSQKGADA